MQNLIIDEITKAVWNEFTAKTHNEKRDYQYSVNDLKTVITEAYKNAQALQLQQTGVSKRIIGYYIEVDVINNDIWQQHYNRKIYKTEKIAKEAMLKWDVKYKVLPLYVY